MVRGADELTSVIWTKEFEKRETGLTICHCQLSRSLCQRLTREIRSVNPTLAPVIARILVGPTLMSRCTTVEKRSDYLVTDQVSEGFSCFFRRIRQTLTVRSDLQNAYLPETAPSIPVIQPFKTWLDFHWTC